MRHVAGGASTFPTRSWNDGLDGALLCHALFGVVRMQTMGPRVCDFDAALGATQRGRGHVYYDRTT